MIERTIVTYRKSGIGRIEVNGRGRSQVDLISKEVSPAALDTMA